jgi:hypothetical protein
MQEVATGNALRFARGRYENGRRRGEVQATHGLELIDASSAGQVGSYRAMHGACRLSARACLSYAVA